MYVGWGVHTRMPVCTLYTNAKSREGCRVCLSSFSILRQGLTQPEARRGLSLHLRPTFCARLTGWWVTSIYLSLPLTTQVSTMQPYLGFLWVPRFRNQVFPFAQKALDPNEPSPQASAFRFHLSPLHWVSYLLHSVCRGINYSWSIYLNSNDAPLPFSPSSTPLSFICLQGWRPKSKSSWDTYRSGFIIHY